MLGEFERPLVIGKAAWPRCFGQLDLDTHIPVTWFQNRKAWMTTTIYQKLLLTFNRRMRPQNRQVILFVDNAPPHPPADLSHVKVVFFPANTTSVLQPLDQGIIRAMKLHYRKRLLRSVLARVDDDHTVESISKSVSVLDACHWIVDSVKDISPTTVGKCFANARFSVDPADSSVNDPEDDLSPAQLMASFKNCAKTPEPLTTDDFINIGSGILTTETVILINGRVKSWKTSPQAAHGLSQSLTTSPAMTNRILPQMTRTSAHMKHWHVCRIF